MIKYSTDNSTFTEYTAPIANIEAGATLYVYVYYTGTSYKSATAEITVVEPVLGDINGDKVVDAADLSLVRQAILGAATVDGADLNGDGDADILDLVIVANNLTVA